MTLVQQKQERQAYCIAMPGKRWIWPRLFTMAFHSVGSDLKLRNIMSQKYGYLSSFRDDQQSIL